MGQDFDPYSLINADEPTAQDMARARAAALRGQNVAGLVLGLAHDPTANKVGAEMTGQAQHETDQLGTLAGERFKQAIEKMRFGPSAALNGLSPEVYEALTKRKMLDKLMVNPLAPGGVSPMYGTPGGAQGGTPQQSPIDNIADDIVSGKQPPDLKGMYRYGAALKDALHRRGFDLSSAQEEWQATQRHIATLNGPQQERLRQAIDFSYHSLDNIEKLFEDWKSTGLQTGIKSFNRFTLAAAKNLPGDAGASAQALDGAIHDWQGEYANVLMGGTSPTDQALKLASQNLSSDWNEATIRKAVQLAKTTLQMRKNAMMGSTTAGVGGSRYDPSAAPPPGPGAGAPPPGPGSAPRRTFNPKTGRIE